MTYLQETVLNFDQSQEFLPLRDPVLSKIEKLIKNYLWFNALFVLLAIVEIFLFFYFFTGLANYFLISVSLAILFFTCFTYFTLKVYFQTKKPEKVSEIKEEFLSSYKELISYQEGVPEHHILLANACCKLANWLHGKEYTYFRPPSWLETLGTYLEKISCRFHWQDFHHFKEILLKESVKEHIKLVKCEPISMQAHAALANAYIILSSLYLDPRTLEGYDEDRWVPSSKFSDASKQKFRLTAERAIEEFKILSEFAPDDPWVHSQLAYSYRDLQMPEEEIKEYEILHRLNPDDKENVFRLGVLYFQQGLNAKGLMLYEELKRSHFAKAETLIKHYGDFDI